MTDKLEWLSVLDIEEQTKIPNATIRRYIRNHGHHLNIKKRGKSYFIALESIKTIKEIRKIYDEGKNIEQVEESLIKSGIPMTITITEDDKNMTVDIAKTLQDMKTTMNEQKKMIQSLGEQLQKQQEYIDFKLEERDRKLIKSLREIQQTKKEIAIANHKEIKTTTDQQKKWYQFWKK